MIETVPKLNVYFEQNLQNLSCKIETKTYISSTFTSIKEDQVLSKKSLTLTLASAKEKNSFKLYQELGDWLLWASVFAPEHLKNASKEYYDAIAQLSYYQCYLLLKRQWQLFEEISDCFPIIVYECRSYLIHERRSANIW